MGEIDLKQLFQILLRRWWIIISFTVCTLILGIVYSFYIVKPVYQADTSLYIGKSTYFESISIMYNDVLLNDRLVKDYREIIKSRLIVDEVIKEMNLKDISYSQLSDKLNASSKEDTHLISITVTDYDPEFAKNLADMVAEVFKKKAVEIMRVENIQVIDKAIVPVTPVKPNKLMNIAVSFLIGLLMGVSVIFLLEYLNDTIKTPDDVLKTLDLSVIGTIPVLPD